MKLSIIVALYNTEEYIEKCIRSVYLNNKLALSDFEVIIINDGSKDNSQEIVENLQTEFSNIILINKENGGQSAARNIGFKLAKGEYIFCLDSDDSIRADAMSEALEYCFQKKLDMLPIFFEKYNESFEVLPQKKEIYPVFDEVISGGEFLNRYTISGSMWRYFYKTSLIREKNLILTEGIYHEDEEFIIKFLSYTDRISHQKHLVYNHLVRGNSTVNNKNKAHRIKLLNDIVDVISNLKKHSLAFDPSSAEFMGISKKIEQLTVSMFLRMKEDNLNFNEVKIFQKKLKEIGVGELFAPGTTMATIVDYIKNWVAENRNF